MERIFFRTIIVLSLLGILIGVPAIYIGTKGVENWPGTLQGWNSESYKTFTACRYNARNDDDRTRCSDAHFDEISANLNNEVAGYKSASKLQTFGFGSAIILPPALFAFSYVLRWILTGRWKFAPKTRREAD